MISIWKRRQPLKQVTRSETVRNNTVGDAVAAGEICKTNPRPPFQLRARYNGSSVKIFTFLLFPWILCAQDRPQFIWQGDVDGIDVLYLRDNVVNVKVQEGAPAANQGFKFYDRLPQTRQ